jgi:menaquinone-9 beta-reductase
VNTEDVRGDALIIGGGPAGAATACHLARTGKNTLLIEKEKQAHHKVCGEFLSFEAQHYMRVLGVDAARLGAAPISHIRLMSGKHVACARLPFQALGLSRFVLDEELLARAVMFGAEIKRGLQVKRVMPADGRWHIETNAQDAYAADAVFLATGKHELHALKRGPDQQNDFIGFKMHFSCTPRQRRTLANYIDLILFDGGYAGLQLVEDQKANLCLVINRQRFAQLDKKWDVLLEYLARSSAHIQAFLDMATPSWGRPTAIASIPYGYIHGLTPKLANRIFRLGDQFAVIPSFSGDGVSIALHTAKLAAESYLTFGNDPAIFHRHARNEIHPQMRAASLVASAIKKPAVRSIGLVVCRAFPSLVTHMASRTRLRAFA